MKTFVYGDNVDTDVIIPARHLNVSDPVLLASHCMEDIDPVFAASVKEGDVILAGENFGCGSSREHAPMAIKSSGISVVVAKSFARIFYRNAINIGLALLECPEIDISMGPDEVLEVDIGLGTVQIGTKTYRAKPLPPFIRGIIQAGGLLPSLADREGKP